MLNRATDFERDSCLRWNCTRRGDPQKRKPLKERAEYWESRSPSQPLSVAIAVVLGVAAIIYGIVSLLS